MGTYCCQFASLVFSGLKPEKIIASGHLNTSGVDDSSSATIIYPNGKTATLITHSQVNFPCEALVIGTKGTLKVSCKKKTMGNIIRTDFQNLHLLCSYRFRFGLQINWKHQTE